MIKLLKYKYYFAFIVFLFGCLGIVLQILRATQSSNSSDYLLVTSFYFTTQTNLVLTLTSLLFVLKVDQKKWFKYLMFIALFNAMITAVIFHLLLSSFMENIEFIQHVLHTINPILFVSLYVLFYRQSISLKKFWISLIHPLLFLLLTYLFIEPIFGDLIEITMPNFESARYIYPFLDPRSYGNSWQGLWTFVLGIMTPLAILFSLLLLKLKQILDKKYINQA